MAGNNPIYYWDTCIFLAWLKNEVTRKQGEMDGVREVISKLNKRQVTIMTSVLTITEISSAKLPAGTQGMLEQVMQRPNMSRVSVDLKIASLARDLRNHYITKNGAAGLTLTVPDSLHLATAILYKVTEFHTFDEHDKPKHKALGLIPLNGDVAGHALKIGKPFAQQAGFINM